MERQWYNVVVRPVMALLEARCGLAASPCTDTVLLAIAHQEVGFAVRSGGCGETAPGAFGLTRAHVQGVLRSPKTSLKASVMARSLGVRNDAVSIHEAIRWNDQLGAVMSRLLIAADGAIMPYDLHTAWLMYVRVWRPAQLGQGRWAESWFDACEITGVRNRFSPGTEEPVKH